MSSSRRRSARNKSNRKNNNTNTNPPQIYNNKKNKEIMNKNNKNNNNSNNNPDIPCLKLEEDDDDNNNSNNESDNELILKTPNFSINHNKKPHQKDNNSIHNSEEERKEKEEGSTSVQLSYCRGLSKTPLAVPMVADINQQSVTRNDAKQITQTRLKRLKQLSLYSEKLLSKDEKNEKKRIIRLEKNRRAAAMSRRKKKMYVKNLEEKTQLMARHLAISEMENAHLRALLHATQQQALPHSHSHSHLPLPPPIHSHHVQHFQTHFKLPHFAQMPTISTCSNSNAENITSSNSSAAVTNRNSMEPTNKRNKQSASVGINEPCSKKRRLNDGSSMKNTNINTNINTNSNDSLSASCDTSISDISILEPLQSPPSPLLVGHGHGMSMGMTFGPGQSLLAPNLAQIHPSRLIPYHPCISYDHYDHDRAHLMRGPPQRQINNVDKIEAIVLDKDDDDNEQDDDNDDIPPSVVVPRLSDEFINILDNDLISQGIDECGSII